MLGPDHPSRPRQFIISGAPHRPITPSRLLRLAYSGPPIIKSPADVLAIIKQRTADILSDAELALVVRVPAIEGPNTRLTARTDVRQTAFPASRKAAEAFWSPAPYGEIVSCRPCPIWRPLHAGISPPADGQIVARLA